MVFLCSRVFPCFGVPGCSGVPGFSTCPQWLVYWTLGLDVGGSGVLKAMLSCGMAMGMILCF